MPEPRQLTGGELNAAITSALVWIPPNTAAADQANASTFYHGNPERAYAIHLEDGGSDEETGCARSASLPQPDASCVSS
jgi:hypothetical protein